MTRSFDLEEFSRMAERVREKALRENRLLDNPSDSKLRSLVAQEPGIKKTIYDNFVAESEPTSRSQMFTKNSLDDTYGEEERKLLIKCEEALSKKKLISVDRLVGNGGRGTVVRLICPDEFAHIAYGGKNLFYLTKGRVAKPDYQIVFFGDEAWGSNRTLPLSQKDITIRLAFLKDGRYVKVVRNSNYIGEYKKGVFAAEDWYAKARKEGIFLHAGCREDYLQSFEGDFRTVRTLLTALSSNGKTTTTCRILAKKPREKSWLVQDDGGTLTPNGAFYGFEGGGVFVKTEGINPGEQTEIYYGLLKRDTVLENVFVTPEGEFDLYNYSRTSNGRAVVLRRDFMHSSPYIDVPRVDNFILITRGPLIPAISKLNTAQAVAFMVLGQAMESSAGDPTKAGEIRSEFFYDPFVSGSRTEHVNTLYEILKGLPETNFYLINTSAVGEGGDRHWITVAHTMGILDTLFRGGFNRWVDSPTAFKVPAPSAAVDDILLHPERCYPRTEFERKQQELSRLRFEAVDRLGEGLIPEVHRVFGGSSVFSGG